MAWLRGKVALGSFPDLAGAVNKISESVKNIEKNFDNALGFQGQPGVNSTSTIDEKRDDCSEKRDDSSEKHESSSDRSLLKEKEGVDADESTNSTTVDNLKPQEHQDHPVETNIGIHDEADSSVDKPEDNNTVIQDQSDDIVGISEETEKIAEKPVEINIATSHEATAIEADSEAKPNADDVKESQSLDRVIRNENSEIESIKRPESVGNKLQNASTMDDSVVNEVDAPKVVESVAKGQTYIVTNSDDNENADIHTVNQLAVDDQRDENENSMRSGNNLSQNINSTDELETPKNEMKKMESALLGAARQAQSKADEIAKLMIENEQLKSLILDEKKKKSNEAEIESIREECHHRVSTLEKKVHAVTRERDTLRKEQNKRSDATALLKEKDEIITQVMAEGEELSKKQAVQESTIKKLRAQIREFEEENKGLINKLQIEENKVENLKKEKIATDKQLQETIEKSKTEIAAQKEHYMNALTKVKETKTHAQSRLIDEAKNELERQLKETKEREAMLVQTLEELRQTLSRKERQAVFREDRLSKDIDDLQKRYQASERRCEELVMQVPESTRPLLRQIEAMQETTARKAEAWAAAERSLNIRLQDAETKAATAEERDRSVNDRLTKTLSRINVLEAQISCLRSEQTQLTKSLEKERQTASENRQEYLALKEESDTHKGQTSQLKEEITELKRKHKRELQEALTQHELLQQDVEHEKSARLELEKTARLQVSAAKTKSVENGLTHGRLSSAGSLSSMEESSFLQASLDSSHNFSEKSPRESNKISYYLKSMTPNAFETALRQKEGEIASYMSRLASMETIRDSLSEELVKMTKECEKLRSEVALLPSIKAELEALKIRHSAALELMGERDEELEELRADIVDLKEMYREQVTVLVNKIQKGSSIVSSR